MIQQRVELSAKAHARIAQAQRAIGLARFDQALGYWIEGVMLWKYGPDIEAERMRRGMGDVKRKRRAKRSSRVRA